MTPRKVIHDKAAAQPLLATPWAQLFAVSFVVLFFELACIRWIPAYIRYLSYFSNFVLLASFLGLGVGLLLGKARVRLLPFFPPLLLLFLAIVSLVKFELLMEIPGAIYFHGVQRSGSTQESYLLLPFVVGFVGLMFATLSQEMGRLFDQLRPLQAYALNIGGSMAGIGAFFLISLLGLPPLWWFAIVAVVVLLLHQRRQELFALSAVLLAISCTIVFSLQQGSFWSPYYRITMGDLRGGGKILNVNNIAHQTMQRTEDKEVFYNVPYQSFRDNHFRRALIIGAGAGSDASFALHYGVEQVTAVEIDPLICDLGRRFHPLQPYSAPNVKVAITDARSFLRQAQEPYDLIVYALPDSLTLTSSFANLRLESYLFTLESFQDCKRLLAPHGLLVLYNFYRADWLIEKIAGMLDQVFGYPPAVVRYKGTLKAAVFMTGEKLDDLLTPPPRLGSAGAPRPATDDWPFLYMKEAKIPGPFLGGLAMMAVFGVVSVLLAAPRQARADLSGHFFFLGAAFMLLETTSIVRCCLLYGATWMVNSLVIFAILGMVLLAVLLSHHFTIRRLWICYLALFAALLLNYVCPLERLLAGGLAERYVLSSLVLFSPIFLANLIFAQTFKGRQGNAAAALASNTLGALFGGLFEYGSLALGYRNLIILAALFYALSLLLLRGAVRRERPAA